MVQLNVVPEGCKLLRKPQKGGVPYLAMCVHSVLILPVKKDNTGLLMEVLSLNTIQVSEIN
jgi:hypothetical protein